MVRVHTSAISANVVKFQPFADLPARSLIIKAVGRKQPSAHPKAGVPVLLRDRENVASGRGVNADLRVCPVAPLRNFRVVVNATAVLRLRAKLHVVGIAARAITAKVVKGQPFRNWAVALGPVPTVGKPKPSAAPDAAIAMDLVGRELPASGSAVDDVLMLPAVASAVHLRLPGNVAQAREFSDGRLLSASTFANAARVSDAPYNWRHAVASNEPGKATPQYAMAAIGADGRLPAASALTKAGWVGAARIVGLDRLAAMRHAAIVALQIPRLLRKRLAASACAGLCALKLNDPQLFAARLDLVAMDESAAARKSPVGTICDLAASTLAKLAKIDLGHLIFSRDRWSAGTGVHALGQPFYCIVKEAA
jgi:hypothetical protein